MLRIELIRNQINCRDNKLSNPTEIGKAKSKQLKYISSAYDYLDYDQFLTTEERAYRLRLHEYLEREVKNQIIEFNERSEFPFEIVRKFIKKTVLNLLFSVDNSSSIKLI